MVICLLLNTIKSAAIRNLVDKHAITVFCLKVTLQYFKILALFKYIKTFAVT